ncbi:MAG: hypothetical protein ABIK45_06580 [Pseudomonadota bacterium]
MNTLATTTLILCGGALVAFILMARGSKGRTSTRPSINIDFDTAKEREDKNRYFS